MTPFLANTGYLRVHVGKGHPLADSNGKASIHHLVTASAGSDGKKLRQFIKAGGLVHHKNDCKTDNRARNLERQTRSAHTAEHNRKRVK